MNQPQHRLLEQIQGFLRDQEFAFQALATAPQLRSRFSSDHGAWGVLFEATDTPPRVAIFAVYPIEVAPEHRPAMAELLTRLNYGMYVGNFEMDFRDGEVRYRVCNELADAPLTKAWFDRLLHVSTTMTDKHYRAIAAVAAGQLSPEQAIIEHIDH